jgi:hypothetical protein
MCWGIYLAHKESLDDRKLYDQTLADLNNILFQCFRKPAERLFQLLEAEKYLCETLNHMNTKHIPKHPILVEYISRTTPFDSKLIEVLTDRLIDIKFEIQSIRESLKNEKDQIEKRSDTEAGHPEGDSNSIK